MHCPTTSAVHNFKKRFLRPLGHFSPPQQEQQVTLAQSEWQTDASDTDHSEEIDSSVARQQWATTRTESAYVPDFPCALCAEATDVAEPTCTTPRPRSRSHARRSLPSFRSVMEVLYSPSYLAAPSPFPNPPSYSQSDSAVFPARGSDTEVSLLTSSTATSIEGMPLSDPLAQDPSLTGVPSQGIHSNRILPVEPNPPVIVLDDDIPEEPLPAYSRFDQRRRSFPLASDILGPYPPLSTLRPLTR